MTVSRTQRSIQNSKVSLIFFLIQIFVGFYSRKVFLDCLGDEIIGLNTTLGNILSFLNLAELGIGVAMATSLYKPIHDNNQKEIIDILSVQGILYRRIAYTLCIISIPVLIALPYIFLSVNISIIYIYIAYLVFFSGSIFSYLWNYRQILIQADQKNYKLMPWIHIVRYAKLFLQIGLLLLSPFGIWGWIGAELVGNILTVFVINHVIHKEYPWLHASKEPADVLLKKYKKILTKVKQLFIHKIGEYVLYQTSPLIIYAFVSLNMVTYYGNYMLLIGYCLTLMNVIFEGIGASIGNLIADNDNTHTLDVFWELFTSRMWIAGIISFGMYISISPFISLWIGSKYILSESTLLLLILYMFIQITRTVIDSFKNAYQLFADVWSPLIEAGINLGCSMLFGYLWGLNGILIGINLSLIIIIILWRPYYTFRYGLKTSVILYYFRFSFHLVILLLGALFAIFTMKLVYNDSNLLSLLFVILFGIVIFIIATYSLLFISTKGMRMFTIRIKNILMHKI